MIWWDPFSTTLLRINPEWDYIFSITYTSNKVKNVSTFDGNELNCDCIEGTMVDGVRESVLFPIALDKSPGFKVLCLPAALHYQKIKKILQMFLGSPYRKRTMVKSILMVEPKPTF